MEYYAKYNCVTDALIFTKEHYYMITHDLFYFRFTDHYSSVDVQIYPVDKVRIMFKLDRSVIDKMARAIFNIIIADPTYDFLNEHCICYLYDASVIPYHSIFIRDRKLKIN